MKLIDKYIIKELLGPFFFSLAAFVGIFLGTGPAFRIAEMLSKYKAPLTLAGKLIVYTLPVAVYPMLPMSLLLATLLTFGKLSSNSEITVMKSGGIRFSRIVLPVVVLSLVVSVISFLVAQYLMPYTNEKYDRIVKYEIQKVAIPRGYQQNFILEGQFGLSHDSYTILYAREFDPNTQRFNVITLQELDKDRKLRSEVTAEWAEFRDNTYTLHNGAGYQLDFEEKTERKLEFDKWIFPLEQPPGKLVTLQKKREHMSIAELRQVVALLKSEGKGEYKEFENELYSRSAIPFSCLIFAMVGAPLGMQSNRSSSSVGLGLSLVIILLYYALYALMMALAKNSAMPAAVAAWTPNLLGLAAGVLLIIKHNRK